MDKFNSLIEAQINSQKVSAFTLEGKLDAFSTESLHRHSCHQLLRIRSGISLLVEENIKQPLFSNMTAFIPAGLAHRSIVMGDAVDYKSIYLDEGLYIPQVDEIIIFEMSELSLALFDKVDIQNVKDNSPEELNAQCLNLLLRLIPTEINFRSHFTQIPVPKNIENFKITSYIEKHFAKKITLTDFSNVLHYSERHISRIFKDDLKISIFEYLKLYRIFQSALMLHDKGPSKTVTEIALLCGYESLSSFYKDFKDIFSMTPKLFRRKDMKMA